MITKIGNINLIKDNNLNRISVMYDEFTDDGKTISVNNRQSRIVTDQKVTDAIAVIEEYVNSIIEEG